LSWACIDWPTRDPLIAAARDSKHNGFASFLTADARLKLDDAPFCSSARARRSKAQTWNDQQTKILENIQNG